MTSDDHTYLFVTSSMGGHSALVDLQRAFFDDGRTRNPIVELRTEMFSNSYGSQNHKPVFRVVGWDEPQGPAKPAPRVEAKPKRPAADIIDDSIDFADFKTKP